LVGGERAAGLGQHLVEVAGDLWSDIRSGRASLTETVVELVGGGDRPATGVSARVPRFLQQCRAYEEFLVGLLDDPGNEMANRATHIRRELDDSSSALGAP
jgi:hypothetical protein